MITGDEQAFPLFEPHPNGNSIIGGLTIRQHFASLAMQGLLVNPHGCSPESIARLSLIHADHLIKGLNGEYGL